MLLETRKHATFKGTKSGNVPNNLVLCWLCMITFVFWCIAMMTYIQLPATSKQILLLQNQNTDTIQSRHALQEQLKQHRVQNNNNHNAWFKAAEEVKETFITAWYAYEQNCFAQDELLPAGPKCRNWIGLGLTVIDAIDSMYIMNIDEPYAAAQSFINHTLNFNKDTRVSVFETVIRCVGAMVSMYDITNDELYLNHLRILMDNLLPAFNTQPLQFPASDVNLFTGATTISSCDGGCVVFADIASIQLEFNAACDRLGDYKYCAKSDHVINVLDPQHTEYRLQGMPLLAGHYPTLLGLDGTMASDIYRWGAMGDSFYEYLLKLWIYEVYCRKKRAATLGYFYDAKRAEQYRRMYITAVDTMLEYLYLYNNATGLYYIAEIEKDHFVMKMDELACFVGGNLALASYRNITKDDKKSMKYLNAAIELTETCYQMWHQTQSGVAPEFVVFDKKGMHSGSGADFYVLRPETVESIFYLYRITKNEKYRMYGYEIYKAIETHCKVKSGGVGYAPINQVSSRIPRIFRSGLDHVLVMHSFFLSETLKYLFLLFSDEQLLSLDKYVFNTEAHPIVL